MKTFRIILRIISGNDIAFPLFALMCRNLKSSFLRHSPKKKKIERIYPDGHLEVSQIKSVPRWEQMKTRLVALEPQFLR